ncbi:hypothetical protein HY772_10040 [Candidatus Woesearchaeota archaeon]|nr:hypothetical protein [Candidatus Woesearchaeota archaeon]
MPRKKGKPEKSVREDRTFGIVVLGLVCVIVLSVVVLLSLKSPEVKTFAYTVAHPSREELNTGAAVSVQSEQYKDASLTGNENESMVKKILVGKASSVAATDTSGKGPAIRIEDFVSGPPDGFVDNESGKVLHYLNASLVNSGSVPKDCSVEINTLNGEDTISSISHIGVVKPSEKRGFSLLLLPISGHAQLTVKPVCT